MHLEYKPRAWLLPAATLLFTGAASVAQAETGADLAGSASQEEYVLPLSTITIDWTRVTLTPWWMNDEWRVAAELPFLSRDAERHNNFGTLIAAESDSGLGDVRLTAQRSWRNEESPVSTYVGGWLKLPTGDENAGTIVAPTSLLRPTRRGQFSLGTGSTDVAVNTGVNADSEYVWATAEAGYIFIAEDGAAVQEDRPTGYLGLGLTPVRVLELAVEFDYEGEVAAGSGTLEQVTWTVTLRPTDHFAVSASTYTDNRANTPDSNWTLSANASW